MAVVPDKATLDTFVLLFGPCARPLVANPATSKEMAN